MLRNDESPGAGHTGLMRTTDTRVKADPYLGLLRGSSGIPEPSTVPPAEAEDPVTNGLG